MASHAALKGVHNYVEFKDETIAKRVKKMLDLREFVDVENEHVRISYGNRKTTAMVPSISLIPIADCKNCSACKNGCYDIRNVCCYKGSQMQRAVNSAILKKDPVRYFKEVQLHAQFHRAFRYHVGGDITCPAYLTSMVDVAIKVPTCQFLAFTKQFAIVNDYLNDHPEGFPENLHIIFSDWKNLQMDNPHNLPVSSPIWKDGSTGPHVTENRFKCPGNCAECVTLGCGCWTAQKGDTILFEAH